MSQEGAGLSLPPKNAQLRKEEEKAMHGEDLAVSLHLPDGKVEVIKVKVATEVGYVKLMLSQKVGQPAGRIDFYYNETRLLDPMSFCDHKGVKPPGIDVQVKYT